MPKYILTVTLHKVDLTIDTDDFPDAFAKSEDNPEPLDPTDQDVVHDWFIDLWKDYELIDLQGDIEVDQVRVKPSK